MKNLQEEEEILCFPCKRNLLFSFEFDIWEEGSIWSGIGVG